MNITRTDIDALNATINLHFDESDYSELVEKELKKLKRVDLLELLLAQIKENEKLALIPGGHKFFGDRSEGYIRICIATGFDVLKEGLDRLKAGVEKIKEHSL